jgi:hypothetical protein
MMDVLTGLAICGNSCFRDKYKHLKQGAEFSLLPLGSVTMYSSAMDRIEAILDKSAATTYSSFCLANKWLTTSKQNIAGIVVKKDTALESAPNRKIRQGSPRTKRHFRRVKEGLIPVVGLRERKEKVTKRRIQIIRGKCGPIVEFIW